MLRPFCPTVENLEKREVFSANLLIGLGNIGVATQTPAMTHTYDGDLLSAANHNGGAIHFGADGRLFDPATATWYFRQGVAVGDFNGDGRPDLAATQDVTIPTLDGSSKDIGYRSMAPILGSSQQAALDDDIGRDALPSYLEQGNIYKSSQFSNTVLDDDSTDDAIAAHDALFAELTMDAGDDPWSDRDRSQIIGVLIALLADGATRGTAAQDGTSNTLMHGDFSSRKSSVTDLVIDPFTALLSSLEYRRDVVYVGGSHGGIWKTTA
jgi:hypothetical protein